MTTCIIIHNIIIEDKHNLDALIQDVQKAQILEVEMIVIKTIKFN